MARKKSERKPKTFGEAVGFRHIFESETTDFFLGFILLALSIYMIIAMVSFFSTGPADQSTLENMRPGEWLNNTHVFTNTCGSAGALLSYYLISVNFGLPAFLIPAFIILAGLKLMHVIEVNLWKWFLCLTIVMVWLSVTFSKFLTPIMGDSIFNPGGQHGAFVVEHIENVIGAPGLTAILLIVAVSFLTYLTSETITVIRKAMNPLKYVTKKVKFTVTNRNVDGNEEVDANNGEYHVDVATNAANDNETDDKGEDTLSHSGNVVDLTDMSQFSPKPAPAPVAVVPHVTNAEQVSQDKVDSVIIKNGEEEKAANGQVGEHYDLNTPINPWEPFVHYKFPSCDLLKKYSNRPVIDMEEIKANNARIVEVLNSFGVQISKINATVGPTVTLYEITPAEGVRISKIRGLEADIALSLAALGIRIIAPIPGKGTIGIEVPNKNPQIVSMESVLNTKKFQTTKMALPMALGKTITNEVFMVDLAKLPHLLVAGATGQGKSVGLNAIITSLLYKKHPNELKFVLVDPKKVEFSIYNKIAPHYMAALPENEDEPIITDVQRVVRTLNSLCKLMDHRYDLLKKAGVKKITEYNDKFIHHQLSLTDGHEYMPYIVVIIDEFGDLIMTAGKEIELPIARIAQKARAVGIHMIIATQRPTVNIITGTIKANFPGRMAFKVMSSVDSKTILDGTGANQLIGRGDMLILDKGTPVRVQCAFVDTPEVIAINKFIADQPGYNGPLELPEPINTEEGGGGGAEDIGNLDPLFGEAARVIINTQQGSTSLIQRKFSIGYNRAGRLMDQLEKAGVVGAAHGSKPRDVLIQDEETLQSLINTLGAN